MACCRMKNCSASRARQVGGRCCHLGRGSGCRACARAVSGWATADFQQPARYVSDSMWWQREGHGACTLQQQCEAFAKKETVLLAAFKNVLNPLRLAGALSGCDCKGTSSTGNSVLSMLHCTHLALP